jgi:hypothetical protein
MHTVLRTLVVMTCLVCGIVPARAGQSLLLHAAYGSYNKVYYDPTLKEEQNTTFAACMTNYGGEYRNHRPGNVTAGGGFVCTRIEGRSIANAQAVETLPATSLLAPYIFTGFDSGMISLEAGLGCYLTIETMNASSRLTANGDMTSGNNGADLQRRRSHVLPNLALRLFPEQGFHLAFRYGRGQFHGIDSYCHALASIPLGRHVLEGRIALPADWIKGWTPQTNQSFCLGYAFRLPHIEIGFNAGYLAFNHRGGGDGNMPVFDRHNFSVGSHMVFRPD